MTTFILAALVADGLGEKETRNRMLAALWPKAPAGKESETDEKLRDLVQMFQKDLAAGGTCAFDLQQAIEKGKESDYEAVYYYALGEYLRIHGKEDQSPACWLKAMAASSVRSAFRTLAGAKLVALNQGPELYRDAISEPLK